MFVLLDSMRLTVKSNTTHSTCLTCDPSLLRSLCLYVGVNVIDAAIQEQVSDSQLASELSGGNNVALDLIFAML